MTLLRFSVFSTLVLFSAVTFTLFSPVKAGKLLKTKIIAHRGASNEAPENTIAAFQKAKDSALDFIECDIQLSVDNVPIVFHDHTIYRTTNVHKHIPISALTLTQIRQLDVGSWLSSDFKDAKVPTLEETLQFSRGSTGFIMELKDLKEKNKLLVQKVSQILRSYPQKKGEGPIIVGSTSPEILEDMSKTLPHIPLIAIVSDKAKLKKFFSLKPRYFALRDNLITPELVKSALKQNIQVWAWTVDEFSRAKALSKLGVTGIITNAPYEMR